MWVFSGFEHWICSPDNVASNCHQQQRRGNHSRPPSFVHLLGAIFTFGSSLIPSILLIQYQGVKRLENSPAITGFQEVFLSSWKNILLFNCTQFSRSSSGSSLLTKIPTVDLGLLCWYFLQHINYRGLINLKL